VDIDQRTLDRKEVVSIKAEVSIAVIQTHRRSSYDGIKMANSWPDLQVYTTRCIKNGNIKDYKM